MPSSKSTIRAAHPPMRFALPAAIALAAIVATACPRRYTLAGGPPIPVPADTITPPPPPSARWMSFIGEYGSDSSPRIVLERGGELILHTPAGEDQLDAMPIGSFGVRHRSGKYHRAVFQPSSEGRIVALVVGDSSWPRRALGPESGNQLVVTPTRPLDELRREALAATPPAESGSFRTPDLVELTTLDTTIHLEIRYATSHNLFGTPFYSQARAFLQRPAAEALVRASAALRGRGYGLLVHDGYRPWYVTKMFWEAAPPEKRLFVADPAKGSRHNRGCAVDLTLYDLRTGAPVEMPSTYDETTVRAAADYPGGTSRQRWHRALLRRALEREGFTVNPDEWWHFDYRDWRSYRIMNVPFERIGR